MSDAGNLELGKKNHNKLNVRKIETISPKETCRLAGCQGLCSLCLKAPRTVAPRPPAAQQPNLGQSALYISCPLRNQTPSNWFSEPRHLRPVASNSIIFITGAKQCLALEVMKQEHSGFQEIAWEEEEEKRMGGRQGEWLLCQTI